MKHLGTSTIERQQALIRTEVGKHVVQGQPYALVDFPSYSNVGDSAIWLGLTKVLLEVTGRRPSYVSHSRPKDISALWSALPNGPIIICGGGNFGDIWKDHQGLRYRLMREFPGRQIVQMPQSIQFNDPRNLALCSEEIARHGNFYLMVRDDRSLRIAQENFTCPVSLIPDTAFCLGALEQSRAQRYDTIYMLRSDSEKSDVDLSEAQSIVDGPVWDWLDEPAHTRRKCPMTVAKTVASGKFSMNAFRVRHYEDLASRRLVRGIAMLSQGQRIVTDRLHVHIMSLLLNIPHVALDNSYGKVHGYIDAWTDECPLVSKAINSKEVLRGLARFTHRGFSRAI